jgi:hypothetical protein
MVRLRTRVQSITGRTPISRMSVIFNSLDSIFPIWNHKIVGWEVEYTDEFEEWWNDLKETEQGKVDATVRLLEKHGPDLPYPLSSGVSGSRHSHMRELRIQARGKPLRVLYAFNPKRTAILLVGGDKTVNERWYDVNVVNADRLYDKHLAELEDEFRKRAKDG